MISSLEESDRLKSALRSSVNHSRRTPSATIKAATTSLISDEIPWEASARHDLLSVVDINILEGKGKQLRGRLKETWGDLADDKFDEIAGKRDRLDEDSFDSHI
jgi:hypothetical protein